MSATRANALPAGALARQPIDLVAKVIADEREGAVGKPGGERSGGGLVRADRCAVFVDTFEHDLVLAYVQALAARATDRLHADLGRSPQVVNRGVPRLANRLPVLVEQRLGVGAHPHRADIRVGRPSCAGELPDHGRVADEVGGFAPPLPMR